MKKIYLAFLLVLLTAGAVRAVNFVLDLNVGDNGTMNCADGTLDITSQSSNQIVGDCLAFTPTPFPTSTPLPSSNNQLVNPCFYGVHNEPVDDWQQTVGWDTSIKTSNPDCLYGTNTDSSARISDHATGSSDPGVDERIYQVVTGNGPTLIAEVQCVEINGDVANMHIYGGDTVNGPWVLVWTPFDISICPRVTWGTVAHSEITLSSSHNFYKVELQGIIKSAGGGIKFGNAYFESK